MSRKKRCIIIYAEGETEIEFYDSILIKAKEKYGISKFNADKIIKKCLRGITKFDKKLLKKFEYEIIPKYKDYEIIVFYAMIQMFLIALVIHQLIGKMSN